MQIKDAMGKLTTKTTIITIFTGMYEELSSQIDMYLENGGTVTFMKKVKEHEDYEKWLVAIYKDWDNA